MNDGRPPPMSLVPPSSGAAASPIMMPSRPESQCSQVSASGRTTTSRRGRARSPVDYNRRNKDPSSAAAAAAAVAKAIQDQQTPWFNSNNFDQYNENKPTREEPQFHDNFDNQNSFDIHNSFSFTKNDLDHHDNMRNTRQRYDGNMHSSIQMPESRPSNSLEPSMHRSHSGLSSVFRGQPRQNPKRHDQQEILFSLRSHSASFEESKEPFFRSNLQPPLSPEEPPRIQNSHHQNKMSSDSFFFEPQRSHRSQTEQSHNKSIPPFQQSNSGIDIAPTLSLFNHSFESFGGPQGESFSLQNNSFGAPISAEGMPNQSRMTLSRTPSYAHKNSPDTNAIFSKNISSQSNAPFMSNSPPDIRQNNSLVLDIEPSNYIGPHGPRGGGSQKNDYGNEHTMLLGRESCITDRHMSASRRGNQNHPPSFEQRMRTQNKPIPSHTSSSMESDMRTKRSASPETTHSGESNADINPLLPPPPIYEPVDHYSVLLANKEAFSKCQFLLPKLMKVMPPKQVPVIPPKNSTGTGTATATTTPERKRDDEHEVSQETSPRMQLNGNLSVPQISFSPETQASASRQEKSLPTDIEIARRRVVSAVCAFGASVEPEGQRETSKTNTETTKSGSFKIEDEDESYRKKLPSRFRDMESRLSWDNEESPPVTISCHEVKPDKSNKTNSICTIISSGKSTPSNNTSSNIHKRLKSDVTIESDLASLSSREDIGSPPARKGKQDGTSKAGDKSIGQPKMRYRCKLCGQPKQNHTCPYQQSLQRSIGVTVYPAVNSFTSCEPGYLALALSEMNNFVTEAGSTDTSPSRISPERPMMMMPPQLTGSLQVNYNGPPQVSPEVRNAMPPLMRQIGSPSSTHMGGSQYITPFRNNPRDIPGMINTKMNPHIGKKIALSTPARMMKRKRSLKPDDYVNDSIFQANDLLFVDGTELCPEQYRIISPKKTTGSYTYAPLPLPYGQRKRLSENLFALSKDIPKLTDDCAHILREAREQDKWDMAVAELTTQVVVMKHCKEGDTRFDGLRKYLLTLGFAC